jgi:hypothetical protein
MHKLQVINTKEIYIIESHHHALLPWAYVRRRLHESPLLITLDYHTDNNPAFYKFRQGDSIGFPDDFEEQLNPLISAIDYLDDATIEKAISNLDFDEHIHTAISAGILKYAFAINLWDQTESVEEKSYSQQIRQNHSNRLIGLQPIPLSLPARPFTYAIPEDGIFTICTTCLPSCPKHSHDQECSDLRDNHVLESFYLEHELGVAREMSQAVGISNIEELPYILDIDLDYFHSERAVEPDDYDTFYRLIRNSEAITVALEPECVEELKHGESAIDSNYLLNKVLEHILLATS